MKCLIPECGESVAYEIKINRFGRIDKRAVCEDHSTIACLELHIRHNFYLNKINTDESSHEND